MLLSKLGFHPNAAPLGIILPVGISFYTFQSISYVVDVYRARVRAERDPVLFFAYVSYFPQLAAGPIERAGHLLAQFREVRLPSRSDLTNGVWLIIHGYFIKMIVADTLAPWVNLGFRADQTLGWTTILATIAFGFQIYGDFKGYSLIAKGLAALMGFELMWNFNFPYWSCSVQEFWHRWHISLSSWLRDYLFIPLGGSRVATSRIYFNLMLTMLLGGLWHGAGWNFLAWGAWHGTALCVSHWFRHHFGELRTKTVGWLLTMLVVTGGWFFFRATDPELGRAMLGSLRNLAWLPGHTAMLRTMALVALPVALVEYTEHRNRENQLTIPGLNCWVVLAIETIMLIMIFSASQRASVDFIYFQF